MGERWFEDRGTVCGAILYEFDDQKRSSAPDTFCLTRDWCPDNIRRREEPQFTGPQTGKSATDQKRLPTPLVLLRPQ